MALTERQQEVYDFVAEHDGPAFLPNMLTSMSDIQVEANARVLVRLGLLSETDDGQYVINQEPIGLGQASQIVQGGVSDETLDRMLGLVEEIADHIDEATDLVREMIGGVEA